MPTAPLPAAPPPAAPEAAVPVPRLAPALVETMGALTRAGYSLLPLGGGPDGKAPLCRFDGVRLSLRQVMGRMGAKGSQIYGIRLEGLVVLDLDQDDPALVVNFQERFGPAAVQVQTSRGRHLWYRAPEGPLPSLRGEGLPVDVKSGANAYVAGPGSVRPDGQTYVPAKGDLTSDALTVLQGSRGPGAQTSADLAPGAFASDAPTDARVTSIAPARGVLSTTTRPALAVLEGGKVPEGQRHDTLVAEAVRAAQSLPSQEKLTEHLRDVASRDFANRATVPDGEIEDVAAWAWTKRLENSLWGADNSTFAMSRQVLAALTGKPFAKEAWWLLSKLVAAHGHVPGKRFLLNREAMNAKGLGLSGRAFLGARRLLEVEGLLRRVKGHRAGYSRAQWQLGRLGGEHTLPTSEPD